MYLFRLFLYYYLCSVALSCSNSTTPAEDNALANNQNSIADSGSKPTHVLLRQMQPSAFSYGVQASGRLESLSDYIVMAEAGGFLEKFTAKTGQYLPAGAAIAVFATEATRLKLERATLFVTSKLNSW